LFTVLTSVIGLLVLSQVVFGEAAGMNVIGNLQAIINGFVGEGASLAGLITLLLIVGLLDKHSKD
jgi:predicted alternative tryptophan synthase beta-subunit